MLKTPKVPTDLAKRIESDIQKSGIPLELHVLNVCSTKNTGRMPSVRYEYLDQLREIDLLAFFETMAPNHHTTTDLIIECKKTTKKPWVFFSTPSYKFDNVTTFLKYASEFDLHFRNHRMLPLLAQIYPRIALGHYSDPSLPRCISYCEAFRSGSSPSEIYRAIDSVITYLNYRREWRVQTLKEFGDYSEFYLPIIVVDGHLFEATVEYDTVRVSARSHLQLRTFHREHVYIVDVVTRDQFPQFFEEVANFHEHLGLSIASLKLSKEFRATARVKKKQLLHSFDLDGMVAMASTDARRRKPS